MLNKTLLFFTSAILLGLTVVSLISYVAWVWPIELLTNFRWQYFITSLILSIILFIFWKKRYIQSKFLVIVALVLVGLNAAEILPWYLPNAQKISHNTTQEIRILQFNLNPQNDRFSEVASVVKEQKPDVALFIEVDKNAVDKLNTSLKDILPYSFRSPGGGLALLSSLPIKDARGDKLNGEATNLIATIEMNGKPIQFIGTHPSVPVKPLTFHRRNRQLALLSNYVKTLKEPVILFGDFNLTPWSPYYRQFVKTSGLHNASFGYGILPSWPRSATHVHFPNWIIPFVNIPIDHCFVSKQFRVASIRTGASANSDHASLITELLLPYSLLEKSKSNFVYHLSDEINL